MKNDTRHLGIHAAVVLLLLVLHFVLPAYGHGNVARIMVLSVYAMAYNIVFGYTGLLSLGHALFFGAGMYGMGLSVHHLGFEPASAFAAGLLASFFVSALVGLLALRTAGVALMIVTLMFAQAGFLTILYFGDLTRGDEGFVLQQSQRILFGIDLSDADNRYLVAWTMFSIVLFATLALVRAPFGRVLVAIRENEDRTQMLGYDTARYKFAAFVISGVFSGAAGAAYGLLFGYVGATFASVQYSIFPLLWVLLGGASTVLGPFIGTAFMFYLIDISSGITSAYMIIAGIALILLTLFARQGIAGEVRRRFIPSLP